MIPESRKKRVIRYAKRHIEDRKMAAQTEPKVKEIFTQEIYAKPVFWQLQKRTSVLEVSWLNAFLEMALTNHQSHIIHHMLVTKETLKLP